MNGTASENARPGTSDWKLDCPATAREIEGFASAISVNRGDTIDLLVHTFAPHYTPEVFRIGWYQGLGARMGGRPRHRARHRTAHADRGTCDGPGGLCLG